ncbi:uncharacterized protein LOC123533901 [Mercenaria mercenaria]|uniref:uncharacterized protein LOC123533901 n=1 Tax=Mercenaria mercenaria TaxID=6596 RepID=UPI00234F33C4|nr:uncharacterized protein LOC123533901 [Mercenaria mercenaria]
MKILLFCMFYGIAHCAEWSYAGNSGVEYWPERTGTFCNQERQSPIDIPWTLQYQNFDPFVLTGYNNMATYGLKLKNNGHTAQIDIAAASLNQTYVTGGGLDGKYIAVQLHFHWGRNDDEGSEHTFRGQKHPLELHIVHYKHEYGSLSEAVKHGDGLAVLGFFFTTKDAKDNENLAPLINSLDSVSFKDGKVPIGIDFEDLMPSTHQHFYRYMGSLTTPECNEVVVWTVFDTPNTISSAQLAKFRQLYEKKENEKNEHITWNYRPTQKLFGRTVYKTFETDIPPSWHWSYEGVEGAAYWKNYYQTCSGDRQSPIDVPTGDHLEPYDPNLNLESLEFVNYDKLITGKILNNGHTVQVNIDRDDIKLRHGGLSGDYIAAQFHFHWGHNNQEGSEHTHEGKAYPLEMHIVHYKEEYRDLAGAAVKPDGLAVVGVFIQGGGAILNNNYETIVSKLPDVKYKDAEEAISGFNLKQLINKDLKLNATTGLHTSYYRYLGSLTTPPCSPIVTWSVLKFPVQISQEQIDAFRNVTHITSGPAGQHDFIKKNFRPVQDLAQRKVYQSFPGTTTAGSSGILPSMLSMMAIFAMTVLL